MTRGNGGIEGGGVLFLNGKFRGAIKNEKYVWGSAKNKNMLGPVGPPIPPPSGSQMEWP